MVERGKVRAGINSPELRAELIIHVSVEKRVGMVNISKAEAKVVGLKGEIWGL